MIFKLFGASEMGYPKSDVNEQAAYWFAILQNEKCSSTQLKAFSLWLSESKAHQSAYDDTVMMFEGAVGLHEDQEILMLRREVLGVGKKKVHPRKPMVVAMAAVFLMIALFTLPQLFNDTSRHEPNKLFTQENTNTNDLTLNTAVGEQLTRTLNDGSLIELNTDSRIRVQLTPEQRSIYLLKGQAVFSVAHDKNRPFVVFAGDRRVTALGTMFEVRLGNESAQVTLLEGKVKVDQVNITDDQNLVVKETPTIELLPGERYLSNTKERIQVEPESIQSELSWRDGRHVFVDEKISKIVSELNRYTEQKIIINDPQIGELRASANFKMGSTKSLSAALGATFNLTVTENSRANTIIIDWK